MIKKVTSLFVLLLFIVSVSAEEKADEVILNWSGGKPLPEGWAIEGYAFGSRKPLDAERQKAAKTTPNQKQYQTGLMTSPKFTIEHDYLEINCSGTYHPTRCAIRLVIANPTGDSVVRSYSPYQSSNMRNSGVSSCVFDVSDLKGREASIEVKDTHFNGWIQSARIVATDRKPAGNVKLIDSAPDWLPDGFVMEKIKGDFLLLPLGPIAGTPLQKIRIEVDGKEKLATDLPLAFGDIKVAGYMPVYDLTGYQGKKLKVLYRSFTGEEPAKFLIQREIPGRKTNDGVPAFHPHCRIGKLNDPNGLCYVDAEPSEATKGEGRGVYHLFYQYAYGVAAKMWAHYVSTDLMHWEEVPTGLFHDHLGSMHSGSAAVDVMNTSGWQKGDIPPVIAGFTGSRGMGGNDKIQVQGIAFSVDGGKTFTKYEGNPVVGKEQHLKTGHSDARDPKIFWFSPTKGRDAYAKDGYWVMVLYEGKSHAIYTSPNLKDWKRHGEVHGYYECPELFPLAVDGDKDNVKWVMYGGDANYHIGSFDGKNYVPETKAKIRMNYGSRYYAAQTFNNTPKGKDGQERRIQVGWQDKQISIPVELTLKNTPIGLRVCILPVEEIKNLYTKTEKLDGLKLSPDAENPLAGLKGGLYDINIVAELGDAEKVELDVRGHKLTFDAASSTFKFDKSAVKLPKTDKLYLRVVVDNWSTDVYVGEHGLYHMPFAVRGGQKTLGLKVEGGDVAFKTLRVHELKSIWKKD